MTKHSVIVVVPACNEEETIGECIRSISVAAKAAAAKTSTLIVVVCDSCHDHTYDAAQKALRGLPHLIVQVTFKSVGKSRDWGARIGLRHNPKADWIAFTDADTLVREDWLKLQIAASDFGFDAFFGRVDFATGTDVLQVFKDRYDNQTHRYIHGANMGLNVSAYQAVGGIPLLTAHEDKMLVDRLEAFHFKVLWDERAAVYTSTRMVGRAPEGFAATLELFAKCYTPSL